MYLGRVLPRISSDSSAYADTVLHTNKDLAVSILHYCKHHPFYKGASNFSIESVTARTSMVAHDGCYPLLCSYFTIWCVRTFLTFNGRNYLNMRRIHYNAFNSKKLFESLFGQTFQMYLFKIY